jgi:hypothetical protein
MTQFPPPQPPQPPWQAAQPGWGQPASGWTPHTGYPEQGTNRAALWTILGVLGAGALVVAVVQLTGGDSGASTATPEGAVRGALQAGWAGDCERYQQFVTQNLAGDCTTDEVDGSIDDIQTVSESGDFATVDARATATDETGTATVDLTLHVIRIDGEWKVDTYDGQLVG